MTWNGSHKVVRLKHLSHNKRNLSSDSKLSESLLLAKFYQISSQMATHLLCGNDGREVELPFELTKEEMDVVRSERSSFVLGRSGTGKTTVISRKIFQREQMHRIASKGFHELDGQSSDDEKTDEDEHKDDVFLRQIFVSLNPKLCLAVKKSVSGLKRLICQCSLCM